MGEVSWADTWVTCVCRPLGVVPHARMSEPVVTTQDTGDTASAVSLPLGMVSTSRGAWWPVVASQCMHGARCGRPGNPGSTHAQHLPLRPPRQRASFPLPFRLVAAAADHTARVVGGGRGSRTWAAGCCVLAERLLLGGAGGSKGPTGCGDCHPRWRRSAPYALSSAAEQRCSNSFKVHARESRLPKH